MTQGQMEKKKTVQQIMFQEVLALKISFKNLGMHPDSDYDK